MNREEPKFRNQREVYLQALEELKTPHPSIMLPDWKLWNKMVGGFRPKEFSILCGSTGSGKTTFLANLSAQLLKQHVKHFVMSVETGHVDFMKRVISALVGKDINTGEAVPSGDLANIHTKYAEYLEKDIIEFSLYDNRISLEQLLYDIEYMVKEKGCKVCFVDNLNFFMKITRSADQLVEMDTVIHKLIMFCKNVDVHIVMVMHPRKTIETRIESEFDIKGSATSVQEAQNVFLFNRPKPKDVNNGRANKDDRELTLQKMRRRGMHTHKTIIFNSEGTRYVEKGYF